MKTCQQCQSGFEVSAKDRVFYAKMGVPDPTLCPNCRSQRRLAFRNERNWYKRTCDLTGKSIVSIYSPDQPFKIYDQKEWWGDHWDALTYGRNFDFNRPFFEQFRELQLQVPRPSLLNSNSENSEYTTHSGDNRNCYMSVDLGRCEDADYSNWAIESKNIVDCTYVHRSEICYECLDGENLYDCKYCQECWNCAESLFLFDCRDCRNCIGCAGLRGKENYLFNKPASKEAIAAIKKQLGDRNELEKIKQQFKAIKLTQPHVILHNEFSENVSGEFVWMCKNVLDSYLVTESQDCRFITECSTINDAYDSHSIWQGEKFYEFQAGINANNIIACSMVQNSHDLAYCDHAFNSADCFGCVGINHDTYCILNKKYTKEDYGNLKSKIVNHMRATASADGGQKTGEWGEFFPINFSPFAYNESIAQDYFPLNKEQAQKKGLAWIDKKDEIHHVAKEIPAARLPDHIKDVPDDILNWAIVCEKTGRPFRVVPQELTFYRKHDIPIPRLHPEERYHRRVAERNPHQLWTRTCNKCGKTIETSYSPDRPEIIYCEECYLKEVY